MSVSVSHFFQYGGIDRLLKTKKPTHTEKKGKKDKKSKKILTKYY